MSFLKLNHPRGLLVLFFSEMWERFSFYGMRALLVLYMTKQLLYGDAKSYAVYGAYGAMVYAFPVVGGYLADQVLGYRNAIILGGVIMALGHFLMAAQSEVTFYFALALLCVGNAFFKPNISTLVGKLYPADDPRRDAGFTIFYMGINIGACLSPIFCGAIGEYFGWHYGFSLAGVGMLLGLVAFIRGQKLLQGHGNPPPEAKLHKPALWGLSPYKWVVSGAVAAVPIIAGLIFKNEYLGPLLYVVAAVSLSWIGYIAYQGTSVERGRLFVLSCLIVFVTTFWAFFEQAGSSLNLFTDRNVNRHVFGFEIAASVFQSLNPFFIIVCAPVVAWAWIWLGKRKQEPSIPGKFALSMIFLGIGFYALVFGGKFADIHGKTHVVWITLAYLFHTLGELLCSPVGLSAVTKLSPPKYVGAMMGIWFLSMGSFGHHFAALVAKLMAVAPEAAQQTVEAASSLHVYTDVFLQIFVAALFLGAFMGLVTPALQKFTHGVR